MSVLLIERVVLETLGWFVDFDQSLIHQGDLDSF